MNRNFKEYCLGFTLIELLAVIVILAIIATIAVPLVLNTIEDSKKSSLIISAENYVKALDLVILKKDKETDGNFYPKNCLINENGNLICDISSEEIIIETDGDKPTGGIITFKNGNIATINLIFLGSSITKNGEEDFVYNKVEASKDTVLELNGVKFTLDDFETALKTSIENFPVKLLEDITISKNCQLDLNGSIELDLNGKTLTMSDSGLLSLKGNDISLTISNGTIRSNTSNGIVIIGTNGEYTSNINKRHLIINEDVNIYSKNYGITAFGKSTIDFYGKMNVESNGYGISGNGTKNNGGTLFNIYEGSSITVPNGAAIYLPQYGETNVNGGVISGYTAIGIKSGVLNITGGSFSSTGAIREPQPLNNGIHTTGDVILIEQNLGYTGDVQINITGGIFTSNEGGYIIHEYNPTKGTINERNAQITGIYSVKNQVPNTTDRFYYTK